MKIVSVTKNCSYSLFEHGDSRLFCGYSKKSLGGASVGSYKSLNLGLNTDDFPSTIQKNRDVFFGDLGWKSEDVIYVTQTHSALVHNCDTINFNNGVEGDGLFTTQKNKLITVTTADCGNVILFSKSIAAVAVIHCGWKSVKCGIITNAVNMFRDCCDRLCGDIVAFMGPMIRGESYEVSDDFQTDNFYEHGQFFDKIDGKTYFHLDRYIKNQLEKNGVTHICDCCINTYNQEDNFYSYRRDKNTGRIATFAALK